MPAPPAACWFAAGQQDQVDGAELRQVVAGAERGELDRYQAGGQYRDADPRGDAGDEAVDAAADAGAAVRQVGAVEGPPLSVREMLGAG